MMPSTIKKGDYFEKTIVFKVKPQFRAQCNDESINIVSLNKILTQLGIGKLHKMFPRHTPPAESRNQIGEEYVDISLIYRFKYTGDVDIQKAIHLIYNDGHVEYADPYYIPSINYTPDDPDLGFIQYQISQINALNAWDLEKGDTNVVIGIVDDGCQWDHPDLAANVKINYGDPINGIDDDHDGYIDNYRGWDLGNNDNDPNNDGPGILAHGSHVAGDADAVTDNGIHIASPGFKCKFLPVKVSDSSGVLTMGYEGIVYAADHGCSIINCSWGDVAGANFEQDIVNYATINKNALVIAAAGNDNADEPFYPASYDHVISVANVTSGDVKSGTSNYNYTVDVSAPGENIYSTVYDSAYTLMSGTSMASPIAAGAAAIIKSHFLSYSAEQVGERLRVTCDNIDTVSGNAGYQLKLGRGRINMGNSLAPNAVSVRCSKITTIDNSDDLFVPGDTLHIVALFTNFLDPVSNLSVTLSSPSPYVQILQGTFNAGNLSTLDTASNYASVFKVKILPGVPIDTTIYFELTFNATSYSDHQWFNEIVNADYINVSVNDAITTITSKGRIGYNDISQLQGLGFSYIDSTSILTEAGLMIGISPTKVSDMDRSAPNGNYDNDFSSVSTVRKVIPSVVSDFDLFGQFNDALARDSTLGVLVTHRSYAWSAVPNRKYVIVEYVIKNKGTASLNNLYAGIFADWDIQNYNHNRASLDAARRMGYAFNTDTGGLYAGIELLTPGNVVHYAIDNIAGGGGGVDVYSGGYTTALKYQTLSTNRANAGINGQGNDICDVVSSGPFSINIGDSIKVAFALLADSNLTGLQTSADLAQAKYNLLPVWQPSPYVYSLTNYPNPANKTTTIQFSLPAAGNASLEIYNAVGQKVITLLNERLSQGTHEANIDMSQWRNGIYFYRLAVDGSSETHRMTVMH